MKNSVSECEEAVNGVTDVPDEVRELADKLVEIQVRYKSLQ